METGGTNCLKVWRVDITLTFFFKGKRNILAKERVNLGWEEKWRFTELGSEMASFLVYVLQRGQSSSTHISYRISGCMILNSFSETRQYNGIYPHEYT